MKKILSIIIALIVILSQNTVCNAESSGVNWYFIKRGNDTPEFPKESCIVDKYKGYYIDKKAAENDEKKIYMTFDAGYENGNIERILDVLLEENVPGAFFVLNNLIIKNTELVKRMHNEGHLVCNHTSNHKDQTQLSKKEILEGISNLEEKYFEKTGYTMCKFFRFPEGKFDEKSLQAVSEYGYSTFFWSLAYADWDNSMQISEQEALKKLCNNVHCGAIILLHPTAKTNANIIKEFIQRMKSDGYEFLSLYDLIENNT